ncbi:hypothetical protein V6N13_035009 [Hibiscus sabdariffa]
MAASEMAAGYVTRKFICGPHLIFLYKPITGADLSYFIFRVLNKDRNGSDGATPSFFVARSKRALHWKSSTATLTEAGLI